MINSFKYGFQKELMGNIQRCIVQKENENHF